ncbi:MAG: CcdB family protein [Halomonas sp.]|nr:CcdB family protein [Halomonas sp.]
MAQFDVYENRNPSSHKHYPYLLDIQGDLLGELHTTTSPLPSKVGRVNATLSLLQAGKSFCS